MGSWERGVAGGVPPLDGGLGGGREKGNKMKSCLCWNNLIRSCPFLYVHAHPTQQV